MKKKSLLGLAALLVTGATMLSGCGGNAGYDYENNDLTPYVTLPSDWKEHDYKAGLKLKDLPSEEDIQAEIDKVLEKFAEEIDPGEDATVEDGDKLVIDFVGKYKNDGKDDNGNEWKAGDAFKGGSDEDSEHTVKLEDTDFIPGFDEGMIGMKAGETKDIELTFPDDYGTVELQGVEVVFTVTVDSIKRVKLPELTDTLVSENPEEFEEMATAAEYKEHVKEHLTEDIEAANNQKLVNAAWTYIYDNATVNGDGPEGVLDDYVSTLMDYYEHTEAAGKNMHLKEYVKSKGHDSIEAFKTAVVIPEAQTTLKESLVVWTVAKAMAVSVTDDEVNESLQENYDYMKELYTAWGLDADSYLGSFSNYCSSIDKNAVKQSMLFDRAMEKLLGIETADAE